MKQTPKAYFLAGSPTKPDCDLLDEKFQNLTVGDVVLYRDIVEILGLSDWRESRFKSVTDAWRRRLESRGLITECIPGEALSIMSVSEVIQSVPKWIKTSRRKITKSGRKVSLVNVRGEIDDAAKPAQGHAQLLLMRLATQLVDAEKRSIVEVTPTLIADPRYKETATN